MSDAVLVGVVDRVATVTLNEPDTRNAISLAMVGGIAEAVLAIRFHRTLPMWGLWLIAGALSAIAGLLCIAWPDATVLVLAVLLGLWVVMRGVVTLMFGLALGRIRHVVSPAVPT